ncbi:MAG: sugar porter family MFS transporter [Isosphaeraceae bacterium]
MNTAPVSAGVTDEAALSRPSWALLASTMVAALGGCLFGFDTAVISGANDALEAAFGLGSIGLGFTVASALIGTVVGSATAAMPADSLGRRKALIGLAVLYFASALGCALAQDWYTLVVARTLGGLAVGGTSVVSPLYIAEISPARWRGRLVAVVQFNIVLGILLAYLSNYLIGRVDHGASAWRWMLGVQAVPSALFFGLLFFLPESPRWLVASGRDSEARSVQQMLGFDAGEIDRQVGEIRAALDLEHHNLSEPLFSQAYVKPLGLAVTIALFNQLSGINAVMYYAPSIFRMSGAGDSSARLQAVAVGVMNLVFTMIAMTAIDRLGRRKLMIAGSIGYILSLSATAWAFYRWAGLPAPRATSSSWRGCSSSSRRTRSARAR